MTHGFNILMRIIVIPFIIAGGDCSSQTGIPMAPLASEKDFFDLMYAGQHISLGAQLSGCESARIDKTAGKYDMSANNQLGFELRLLYYYNIDINWSLFSGLRAGVLGRNHLLRIPRQDIDPSLTMDYIDNAASSREKDVFYIAVPLGLQKRFWNGAYSSAWFVEAGINFNLPLSSQPDHLTEAIYIPGKGAVQILSMDISLNNNGKPWLGLTAGIGHQWVLKNYQMVAAGLQFNYGGSPVASGTYLITVAGQPDTLGKYTLRGSYLGIHADYLFTGYKKRRNRLER